MLTEIQQFIQSIRRHNPESRTWRNYACDLKLFVSITGDILPSDVTPGDVDRFVSVQVERGFKPATINRRLTAVISLYRFLDLPCPVSPRRHRLRQPQRLARPITDDEAQRFFSVIHDPRDCAMFRLMRDCGLRIAEVADLKITGVHLDPPHPHLLVRGKGSRERVVYVSPRAEHDLRTYLAVRPTVQNEFLFLSYQSKGLSTTAIHKRLMIYRKRAGVSLTAHRLRHAFATGLLAAGVPITSIQRLMGHRRLETTQGYILIDVHQVREDYDTACKKLGGWNAGKGGWLKQGKLHYNSSRVHPHHLANSMLQRIPRGCPAG